MPWTPEQVLALAPDRSVAWQARELAAAQSWLERGCSTDVVWGTFQGSASQPYRIAVDLSGPAFLCTCPSRKVPCKHALALFLAHVNNTAGFTTAEPPALVREWLHGRAARATQPAGVPLDPERAALEQQKRVQRREERINLGVDDLERWLHDLARAGLAEAGTRAWSTFEQIGARLVDAQAGGLARRVRELGALPHTTTNWPERMLIELGRLNLLLEAWRRQETLPADLTAEVRSQIGITESRESVLATPPVRDTWSVLGRRVIFGERMLVQRTWLWGTHSRRWALLLDFAVGPQPLDQHLQPASAFDGELCFYRGAVHQRAVLKTQVGPAPPVSALPGQSISHLLGAYADTLGRNPWLERLPAALSDVVPFRAGDDAWCVRDASGHVLPLAGRSGWHLLALSGGHPVDVFGEWDGFVLWPLSAVTGGRLAPLRSQDAA